jgi:hypothetical protein
MMGKHPDYVLRNNAKRGAITTWCPTCKRKSALGAWNWGRVCRYCGAVWDGNNADHRRLYREYLAGDAGGKEE